MATLFFAHGVKLNSRFVHGIYANPLGKEPAARHWIGKSVILHLKGC